jgi:hypothetical protein
MVLGRPQIEGSQSGQPQPGDCRIRDHPEFAQSDPGRRERCRGRRVAVVHWRTLTAVALLR